MKSSFLFLTAATAVLALSACSPSTPASDVSASVSESAAATVAADDMADTTDAVVTESEASSAATVVVTQAETYDPVVIKEMGQKPGYWEVKHTDPKTKKSYVTHVCIDKPLATRMTKQGPVSVPADRRDYKDDASFKGECPAGIRGGDVQKDDGNKVNAYGDHKPAQDHNGNGQPDHNSHPDNGQGHASAEPSHNPHTTPAEDHANDKSGNNGPQKGHDGNTSRPDDNRK